MSSPDLQIAALLCSRICHDLISPVGAIGNGLEVLKDEHDEDMREHAMSLIESSQQQASARLQFARIAFGAAGSAGSHIEIGDALALTQNILPRGKVNLDWGLENKMVPKDFVKLLLNLVLIAIDCIPRGGTLKVRGDLPAGIPYVVEAQGVKARLNADIKTALFEVLALDACDSRQIQPAFTKMIAQTLQVALHSEESEETVVLKAAA